MKAVGINSYLTIETLDAFIDFEPPKPAPSKREILVAVKAVLVNSVGTKVRRNGGDKVEDPARILSWDASGVVEAAGPQVTLTTYEAFFGRLGLDRDGASEGESV